MTTTCDHVAKRDAGGSLYCMYCLVALNWCSRYIYGSQSLDVVRGEDDESNDEWHVVSLTQFGEPVLLRLTDEGARDLLKALNRIVPHRRWFRR